MIYKWEWRVKTFLDMAPYYVSAMKENKNKQIRGIFVSKTKNDQN